MDDLCQPYSACPPADTDLQRMRLELVQSDPALAPAHAAAPALSWRRRAPGFAALLWLIAGQQVSTAAAASIWRRLEEGLGDVTAEHVAGRDVEALRALGLTRAKALSAWRLATQLVEGRTRLQALAPLADSAATAALVALPGIGRWSAELYLMSCGGRMDIFPASDVALREAVRWVDLSRDRPDEHKTRERAARWSPRRSVAAHLLWAWYGAVRRGEAPHPLETAAGLREAATVMEPS